MAALYSVRVETGTALDPVVLGALARLGEDASLEEASAALLAVAHEREASGALPPGTAALLERALVARGLVDCPRVITDPEAVADGRSMWLRRKNVAVEPFWPGPMQLRYQVPNDARAMTVTFELRGRGSDEPPAAAVLVKRSSLPIAFTYDLVARDDLGDPTGASDKVREVTLVGGDWDLQVPAVRTTGRLHEARVDGLLPGEVVHLSVVATAGVDAIADDVRVVDPRDYDDATTSGGSSGEAPGDAREDVRPGDATASCACATQDPALGWLALPRLLGLVGLVGLVRRRR
jgi:MYXO-CTERM domain-containing protein